MNLDFMQSRPTLAQMNEKPRAEQKGNIPTRLAEKKSDDKDEKAKEKLWRKGCIKRDGKICRHCDRVVVQQLELAPNRLEVHHIASRVDRAVRWDVRNGIVLCAECHEKVTRYRLVIVQVTRHRFTVDDSTKRYINAFKPVTWVEKDAA